MKMHLVRHCLEMFAELAKIKDDFVKLFEQFGVYLNRGIIDDSCHDY